MMNRPESDKGAIEISNGETSGQSDSDLRSGEREPHAETEAVRANLERVLSSVGDAFFSLDREWRYVYINEAALRLSRYRAKEFYLGKTIWEVFPDLSETEFAAELRRAMNENQAVQFENYYQTWNRWFENRVYPTENGISVFAADITDRKRTEESVGKLAAQIEQQARVYETTLSNITDFAYVFDTAGRFVFANQPLLDFLQITLEEIRGKNFAELQYPPDLAARLDRQIREVVQTKQKLRDETAFTSAAGFDGFYEYIFSPVIGKDGAIEFVAGSTRDVTERKQNEQALRESEERFRNMADHAPVMVWVSDASGNCTYLSKSWYEFTGQTDATGLGFGWLDAVHPDDQKTARDVFCRAVAQKSDFRIEYRLRGPTGEYYWMIDSAVPRRGADNEFLGYIGSVFDITERRRAEEQARDSENKLRLALEAGEMATWNVNFLTNTTHWSENHYQLLGVDPQTIGQPTSERWIEAIDEADRARVLSEIETARLKHAVVHTEYRIRRFDTGELRWLTATGRFQYDEHDQPVRFAGVFFDITMRKQAAEQLRESEEKYRALTELSSQMVWVLDASGEIVYLSPKWYEYTDLSLDDVKNQGWANVLHPDERDRIVAELTKYLTDGTEYSMELQLLGRDKVYRWYLTRAVPVRDDAGAVARWIGVTVDIDDNIRAAEAIRQSEERLRLALEAGGMGVWSWRYGGETIEADDKFLALYGIRRDEFDGTNALINARLHPEDFERVNQHALKAFANQQTFQDEFRVIHPDGAVRWLVGLGRAVYDHANNPTLINGINFDITARKKVETERERLLANEQELRLAAEEANRLKDEFLATVSHELRTPLNAILGWTMIARQGAHQPEMVARAFEIIERNGRNQNQIISDILDVSRIITGKLMLETAPLDLKTVIEAAVETVRPAIDAKRINLLTEFEISETDVVNGDINRLQQVFWNLLSNAVKFTQPDGAILIKLERCANELIVSVIDTGEGIEPEFLPFVFDRFRQAEGAENRRHGGLGLGLAIVRHLIELHGGTVSAASAGKGRGTTFTVRLPLPDSSTIALKDREIINQNEQNQAAQLNSQSLAETRVLLVDDELDALEMTKSLLTAHGAKVVAVESAQLALEKLNNSGFDILISDIGMPSLDGYEMIKKLRAANISTNYANGLPIPAIALTAYARAEDGTRAIAAGYDLHLPKPVEESVLIRSVADLTARRKN